jgi:hypothetical protein
MPQLSLILVLGLFLLFPSLTRAGDSYNEFRLLDLELEMLSLKSQMLDLRRARSRQRARRQHASESILQGRRARYLPELQRTLQDSIPRARGPHHRARPRATLPHHASALAAAGGPVGPHAGGTARADLVCGS